jgi:hypothetical protein
MDQVYGYETTSFDAGNHFHIRFKSILFFFFQVLIEIPRIGCWGGDLFDVGIEHFDT